MSGEREDYPWIIPMVMALVCGLVIGTAGCTCAIHIVPSADAGSCNAAAR